MPKFLLYLPFSDFKDYYENKALGLIPISFLNNNCDVVLIVGKMDSEKLKMKIYETNNLDTEFYRNWDKVDSLAKLFYYKVRNLLVFDEIFSVFKILKKEKPDYFMSFNNSILTHFIIFLYSVYSKIHKIKTRKILKLDSDGTSFKNSKKYVKILISIFYGLISILYDKIIVETSCGYSIFKAIPFFGKKLEIVPNSISNEYMNNCPEIKREKTIITVSRINKIKGIDILINSFIEIYKKNPEYNLKIIGPIEDNDYYNELLEIINKNNLNNKILFCGLKNRKELIEIYKKASIFCLFSRYESFAISRLEAIAMRLYVITSEAGCAEDLKGYNVKIVPIDDLNVSINSINEAINKIANGYNFKNKKITSYDDIAKMILNDDFYS